MPFIPTFTWPSLSLSVAWSMIYRVKNENNVPIAIAGAYGIATAFDPPSRISSCAFGLAPPRCAKRSPTFQDFLTRDPRRAA